MTDSVQRRLINFACNVYVKVGLFLIDCVLSAKPCTTTPVLLLHTFNDPFSGTTHVSRYQRGKTNLDFTEARDSEWQWHQLGRMQVYTLL